MMTFVWDLDRQTKGRPASDTQRYMRQSEARIAEWELEMAQASLSQDIQLYRYIKNKTAALRIRMRNKIKDQYDSRVTLVTHQANLKELLKAFCRNWAVNEAPLHRVDSAVSKWLTKT